MGSMDRFWGNLFWNVHFPPMPDKYMDKRGMYVADEPCEIDYECHLRTNLIELGYIEDTPSKPKRKETPKKLQKGKGGLFNFGFTAKKRVPTPVGKSRASSRAVNKTLKKPDVVVEAH